MQDVAQSVSKMKDAVQSVIEEVQHGVKTSCNWGGNYVPCADLALQDGQMLSVSSGQEPGLPWPARARPVADGRLNDVGKDCLWMTHQEQGTLIRMTFGDVI